MGRFEFRAHAAPLIASVCWPIRMRRASVGQALSCTDSDYCSFLIDQSERSSILIGRARLAVSGAACVLNVKGYSSKDMQPEKLDILWVQKASHLPATVIFGHLDFGISSL